MNTAHNNLFESDSGGVIPRRQLFTGAALGAGALAAGAVGGVVSSTRSASAWRREVVKFEVALLGDTWRDSTVNWAESASDFRGMPFQVEGLIYPPGTMQDSSDGFVPTEDLAVGRWFCRGNTLVHPDRPEPHVASTQEFSFNRITPERLFAEDSLVTSGIEGTETRQVATRAVIGGTGRFAAATGVQSQVPTGVNTTLFTDGFGNGPNLLMTLQLLIPEL